jgi:hypothetical protein
MCICQLSIFNVSFSTDKITQILHFLKLDVFIGNVGNVGNIVNICFDFVKIKQHTNFNPIFSHSITNFNLKNVIFVMFDMCNFNIKKLGMKNVMVFKLVNIECMLFNI